ncbi:hypothetical protein GQ53DRAFT_695403 [Thozetella sp. PMI_491]|nr:hypothetical protein GQ53DRAFT_695403 [Thozetella sp. PMI_491]
MESTQKHACSRCRASKLRCLSDTFPDHGKCRRCHDAEVECVFVAIAPRQRRKRTDTRVAALEKQITGMKAALEAQAIPASPMGTGSRSIRQDNSESYESIVGSGYECEQSESHTTTAVHSEPGERRTRQNEQTRAEDEDILDPIGSNLLPLDLAARLLAEFICNVLPEYPIIGLSDGDDFDSLHSSRPTLLLAMATAASRGSDPALFGRLHSRLLRLLADRILVRGHRSLELIQAILVMEVWYDPPEDMRKLNFYMWIQIAGTLANQLGLWPAGDLLAPPGLHGVGEREGLKMGEWRTAFAVYVSMSTVAISLRRPNMMAWTDSMLGILERFEQTTVHANDRRLATWVRLQIIAEDIESLRTKLLAPPDATQGNNSMTIGQSDVQVLEQKLGKQRRAAQPIMNASLRVHFFYCRCKLYEVAITMCQTQAAPLPSSNLLHEFCPSHLDTARDTTYIRVIMSLIQSSHSVLDVLLHLEPDTYLKCPTVTTIRSLYAIFEIDTLWKAIHLQETKLSEIINEEVLALNFYLGEIKEFFSRAEGGAGFQVPRMALASLAGITYPTLGATKLISRRREQAPVTISIENAGETISAPRNDLEAILQTDATSLGLRNKLPQSPTLRLGSSGGAIIDPSSSNFSGSSNAPEVAENRLAVSEFDMMVMPGMGIDPTWLLLDEHSI